MLPNLPDGSADAIDTIVLPVNGSTVNGEELKVRLVLATDLGGEVIVDAGEVESVGQAMVQLLLAGRAEADANGHPFTIINASPAFRTRIEALGLAGPLGLATEEEIKS
nr:STAS domain-containing protein [Stakelama flava]